MNRKWSLHLGKYAGIHVYVHWTFLILIGWIFLSYFRVEYSITEGLTGVLFILTLFVCVVLHEFGHALMARRFHISTRDITLYPIGGVARLENMPDNPKQELMVAAAGPGVNVVIAGLLGIGLLLSGSMPDLSALKVEEEMPSLPFLFSLFAANVALVVFNMIPAFPMDGGRVLRALLALKMDRATATRTAAGVGRILAIVFVFLGFFFNFWLVFIGLFVYLGASGEANYETTRSILGGFTVEDVLMTKYTMLSPDDTLEKAVQALLDGQEHEFLVGRDGEVQGILTRKALLGGLSAYGKTTPVAAVMKKEFSFLTPDMRLKDVYAAILRNDVSVYPVQQGSTLIGIVDKENINELIMVKQAAGPK